MFIYIGYMSTSRRAETLDYLTTYRILQKEIRESEVTEPFIVESAT